MIRVTCHTSLHLDYSCIALMGDKIKKIHAPSLKNQNFASLHSCPCALHSEQYSKGILSSLIILKLTCELIL